jgi:hypothetical protein
MKNKIYLSVLRGAFMCAFVIALILSSCKKTAVETPASEPGTTVEKTTKLKVLM